MCFASLSLESPAQRSPAAEGREDTGSGRNSMRTPKDFQNPLNAGKICSNCENDARALYPLSLVHSLGGWLVTGLRDWALEPATLVHQLSAM